MISLQNVILPYTLTAVNCHLSQGKLIGIMGANGVGKSTLLKAIAGIIAPKEGAIIVDDLPLSAMSLKQRSVQLAYFAQNTNIHWDLSVYDVIALGLAVPLPRHIEQQKVRSISERFSLVHLMDKSFLQLSGGEKARVQLARCCIKDAPLLLADEPIAALDPYYQLDLMAQIKALTPEKTCVIVIHHLALAYRFCDEIILLGKGGLIACGDTQSVLNAGNLAKAFQVRAKIDIQSKDIFAMEKL